MSLILSASDDPPLGNNVCLILVWIAIRRIIKTSIVAETLTTPTISFIVIGVCTNPDHSHLSQNLHHHPVSQRTQSLSMQS